jgi:hypothetical protein
VLLAVSCRLCSIECELFSGDCVEESSEAYSWDGPRTVTARMVIRPGFERGLQSSSSKHCTLMFGAPQKCSSCHDSSICIGVPTAVSKVILPHYTLCRFLCGAL